MATTEIRAGSRLAAVLPRDQHMTTSPDLRLSSYRYELPPDRIAQHPVAPRDASRLLVYHRDGATVEHRVFRDLADYLDPGDLLVVNETRVLPARLHPQRVGGNAPVEVFLTRSRSATEWEALVKPGRRLPPGSRVEWDDGMSAEIVERIENGGRLVRFSAPVTMAWIESNGTMPLPPYIRRDANIADSETYQTIYAAEPGSVAAPTAGLHFTDDLLQRIEAKGVRRKSVVLHVSTGTFRPVRTDDVTDHQMDREFYRVSPGTLAAVRETKARGGRVVAVGTTSVRTLETLARDGLLDEEREVTGWSDLFLHPPNTPRVVDALVTNFHFPETTLLMLVSAFAGREQTLALYREAVESEYRFYSYGDAMLVI